jgi:hypothetical protein
MELKWLSKSLCYFYACDFTLRFCEIKDGICIGIAHRYWKSLNRLLKVCYVPTTRAVLIAFLLPPLTVLMKQTRQPARAVKQSIYLDVYGIAKMESKGPRQALYCKSKTQIWLSKWTCKQTFKWEKKRKGSKIGQWGPTQWGRVLFG